MTTYLGEKAVGIGTVKANMNVGKVITDEKTILGDGFTEQLAVNTLLFATSESVAASAEAVRTEFDGKLKAVEADIDANADAILRTRELYEEADTQIRAEITNVEDRVRELTKSTDGEFVDIKLDVSDLKDADQNIRAEMADLQTQVTAQIAGKQDKLTAGENITIEDGVISAAGGGELPDNVLVNNATGTRTISIGGTGTGNYSLCVGNASAARGFGATALGFGCNANAMYAIQLGNSGQAVRNSDANTFKVANGNGNFEMMSADGTIPAERMSATAGTTGQVLTKTDAGMEWQDATGGGASLPDQTGNSGKFLMTDGAGVSWSDRLIINDYSVSVGARAAVYNSSSGSSVAIGYNAKATGTDCVSIGNNATNGSLFNLCTAIGSESSAKALNAIAIGYKASAVGSYGIQLGKGTNNDSNTLKVANGNGNFEMMDANGNVPLDRLTYVTDQIGDISTALTAILGE